MSSASIQTLKELVDSEILSAEREKMIRKIISTLSNEELAEYLRSNPITEDSFEKQRALFQKPIIISYFFNEIPEKIRLRCFKETINFLKSEETAETTDILRFGLGMKQLNSARAEENDHLNGNEFNGLCKDFLVVLAKQDREYSEEIQTTLSYLKESPGNMIEALKESSSYEDKAGFKEILSIVDTKYITPLEGRRSNFLADLKKDIKTERGLEEIRESIAYLFETNTAEVYYLNGLGFYVRDKRYLLKGDTYPDYYYTRSIDFVGNSYDVVIKKISTAEMSPKELYDDYGRYMPKYGSAIIPIDTEFVGLNTWPAWPKSKPSSFIDLVLDKSISTEERWRISSQICARQKNMRELFGDDFFTIRHKLDLSKVIDYERRCNESTDLLAADTNAAVMNAFFNSANDPNEIRELYSKYNERVKDFAKTARLTKGGSWLVHRTGFDYRNPNFDETNSVTLNMYYFVITLPIDEKNPLSLETNDAENSSENSYNIPVPESFMRKYKKDLTEISDLYKKLLGYIGPFLSSNNNCRTLRFPKKPAGYLEELEAFKAREFTEDEIAIMCNFLNNLNKEDDILEAFPRLVEEYPGLEKELLMIASTCLDGGIDLFNEYYMRIIVKLVKTGNNVLTK